MKNTKRRMATALAAGAVGICSLTLTAEPAHAARVSPGQCAAGRRAVRQAYNNAWNATTTSDAQFWMAEYLYSMDWVAENC